MKYDITIRTVDGEFVAEFVTGESTAKALIAAARSGVDNGDGKEVNKEDAT